MDPIEYGKLLYSLEKMQSIRIKLGSSESKDQNQHQDPYAEFSICFKELIRRIDSLNLAQTQANIIYDSMRKMVEASCKLIKHNCYGNESNSKIEQSLQKATKYMCDEISEHSSVYKRGKICENSPAFVKPKQMAIGIKWKTKFNLEDGAAQHKLVQCDFNYISIIDTLKTKFRDENFLQIFLGGDHSCSPGVIERFCCGEIYKRSDLFQQQPKAIQLLLSIDEFEPCSALKTKSGIHKICAIYMQIINLPQRLLSKLENIHLVALCTSDNLKGEFASLDNILELIVSEIKSLEEIGIKVNDRFIKGTLAIFTFDNLGGNDLFGFVRGFNASHYCRICNLTKNECSETVTDDPNRFRKIDEYNEQIVELHSNVGHIQGVAKKCLLNDLKYFHTLKNTTVDLMHDVLEGVIQFLLHEIFTFCLKRNLLTKQQLIGRVRDFNYGYLLRNSKPSILHLDKKNLNQNASQTYCLFVNLPFILFNYMEPLEEVWICVESLLGAMQIVFSNSIQESDLPELQKLISKHLQSYLQLSGQRLKPKHHFFTHYPSVIRSLGPVKNYWMMRMEAKHRFFTDQIKKIRNFVNITKSLALKHQQMFSSQDSYYGDQIEEPQNKKKLEDLILISKIKSSNLYTIDSLNYNGIEYRKDLLLAQNKSFFKINYIVSNGKKFFWFACSPFKVKGFNQFCNSFELKKEPNQVGQIIIIPYSSLKNQNTYDLITINNSIFVRADTLDLRVKDFF